MIDPNSKRQVVRVDQQRGPDEHGKFLVWVDGYTEWWTIDRIRQAAYVDHDDVQEWVR